MSIGLTWDGPNKIGDTVSISHLPANYFYNYNEKLIDCTGQPCFQFNPFLIRDETPTHKLSLWQTWMDKPFVGPTLAHSHCAAFKLKCFVNSPQLYKWTDVRKLTNSLVIHTSGSGKAFPPHIIQHLHQKYDNYPFVYQIGSASDIDAGFYDRRGADFWTAARYIAECSIFIGLDSAPLHISMAYQNILRKCVLVDKTPTELEEWLPDHWFYKNGVEYFSIYAKDIGIVQSYFNL